MCIASFNHFKLKRSLKECLTEIELISFLKQPECRCSLYIVNPHTKWAVFSLSSTLLTFRGESE